MKPSNPKKPPKHKTPPKKSGRSAPPQNNPKQKNVHANRAPPSAPKNQANFQYAPPPPADAPAQQQYWQDPGQVQAAGQQKFNPVYSQQHVKFERAPPEGAGDPKPELQQAPSVPQPENPVPTDLQQQLETTSPTKSARFADGGAVLPPQPVERPLLVGQNDSEQVDPYGPRAGPIRLHQAEYTENTRQAPRISVITEPEHSAPPDIQRRRFDSIDAQSAPPLEISGPDGTTGIPGVSGHSSQKPKIPAEQVPQVQQVIQKTRRRSSRERDEGPKRKNDVFELTIYDKKSIEKETIFKEKRAHLITPLTLYKEALYTSVHHLGLPTVRLPSTKEDICLYSHVLFKANPKEQMAVMEHIVGEAFPLIVVNTNVRRADGVEAREDKSLPDTYCVITMESQQSGVEFQLSSRDWERISTGTPLRPKVAKNPSEQTRPVPEKRFDQYYASVPPAIKTSVQYKSRTPAWNQRFQCLALRPSVDVLTIEIWDSRSSVAYEVDQNSNKKGKQQASAPKPKNFDVFIGKVSIPVRDIPCEGEAKWHYIKGSTHYRKPASGKLLIEVWLTHAYRHGKNYEEYAEPRIMLEMFWDTILKYESSRFTGEWNGEIPPAATCLTFQYALQTGLSEASQAIIRWNAYAKYSLGLFALERRLTELETALEKARDWKDVRECELESNMIMLAIEKILPVIRNHLHETQETVHEAVKAIKHCRDILKKFHCTSSLFEIQFWIEAEIRMAILQWYEATFKEFIGKHGSKMKRHELIECLARVINEVNKLMRECAVKWKPLFWLDGLINYMPLAYDEFQKMIIHDVEMVCYYATSQYDSNDRLRKVLEHLDSESRALCRALFDLYVETQVFVSDQDTVFDSVQGHYYHLNRYHRWFRPVLVLWLGYALIRASDMISYSIKIDNVIIENETIMTSSSATDAGVVYHQLSSFWKQLNWPDVAEGYVILHYLFEVMCFVTILYARLKRAKLEKEGYFDTIDRFDISERFCTALNNIEYVKESLIKIPDDINMDEILVSLDTAVGESYARAHRVRINNLLTGTLGHIEVQFKKILHGVAERVRPELREAFSECFLFLEDKTKTEDDSLVPVLSYLEDNIVVLHKSLLELNFVRVLQMFWNVTCQEMLHALRVFSKSKDVRQEGQFFERVNIIVPYLVTYFEGSGGGLNEEEIDTKNYRALLLFLKCLSLPTDKLIAAYYREAAEQQMEIKVPSKLGSLTARVNYHSGTLMVEVISAKNLSARDEPLPFFKCCGFRQEASSDPQVEVRPLPVQNFPTDVRSHKTEIKWTTQNPVFNEKFSWRIPESDCGKLDSVLLFTVRDVDVVSRDDFLGQAIIPIAQMPGLLKLRPVAQPMHLELQSVDVKHNPVLSILAGRHWDPVAVNFVKDQEKRVVNLKEDAAIRIKR